MSSLLVILFGMVKQFCRFWIWSETECETSAEYGLQHNSTPPTPTATHCLYIPERQYILYTVFSLGRGEGGKEVRENVEGQQYTSIVPSSMKAPVHKLGRKYQLWVNVSPVYKIC
jgi:hypothetical protein